MIRIHSISGLALTAILGMLLVAGCGTESTKPSGGQPSINETPNLDDEFGGLTTSSEQPAFGDETLAASGASESAIDDEMARDPVIERWTDSDSARVYAVSPAWGILDRDPSAGGSISGDSAIAEATDWTGYVAVNRGGIVLSSTIAFEPDDRIVRPRTDRRRLDWISHTSVSFDGVRCIVIQPLPEGETGEGDSLVVAAGAHRWEFPVDDLADLERIEEVDQLGNKLAIRSFLVERGACGKGWLAGAWLAPADPDSMGLFRGRWVSRAGTLAGYVRGHFGVNREGRRVLFGKYIDESGTFKGLLRGTWDRVGSEERPQRGPRARSFGSFRAEILDEDGSVTGHARGHWRATPGAGEGYFDGRWVKGCFAP